MGNNALCFEKTKTISEIKWKNVITGNTCYIIYKSKNKLVYIYHIEKKSSIKIDSYSSIIKFHPKIENIFILAERNIAKVFEIDPKKFECNERIKVKGHTGDIKLLEFSDDNGKIFGTYSTDNTLKIWKLDNAFCLCNILLLNEIDKFQIYKEFVFYFNTYQFNLTSYNYIMYEELNYDYIKEDDFIILNEENIVTINDNNILIKYSYGNQKEEMELKDDPLKMFYDKETNYLYIILLSQINVINMEKMKIIFEKKIFLSQVFYMNNHLNKNIYANFILLNRNIEFYSLYPKTNDGLIPNYDVIFAKETFWKGAVSIISGTENLKWEANIDEALSYKNYLDSEIISEQIIKNYSIDLKIKKIEVEKEFNPEKDYDYINFLKMIIKDNTNNKLIAGYLKYLKDLENKGINIDFPEKESFENEYDNYKVLLSNEELKSNNLPTKTLSEKENFISLLDEIIHLNGNNIDKFKEKVKNKLNNIQLFNQPIDISNKELYWYRNVFIMYYSLNEILNLKNKDKLIELIQENIKTIVEKDVFNKNYILDNAELLTSITILIALPQTKEITEFNINLILSSDPNYNYLDEINKNKIQKYSLNSGGNNYGYYYDNYILKNPSSLCIANFVLNIEQSMELDLIELNNYEMMKKAFNEIYDFEKMFKFLSIVISSRVFREAFEILYPDYYQFPFKDENDALEFLKKYFHFVPFKSYRSGAITEKFSLEILFLLKARKMNISSYFDNKNKNIVKKILYRGSGIAISSHEINHEFYNIFLKHSNGKIPLMTPRKKFINESEGGKNMERLLFNQPLKKLSLLECMYLLNEKNYSKSLNEFKEGFNECREEDIKIGKNGVFEELNKILEIKNFLQLAKTSNIRFNDDNLDSNFLTDTYIDDLENSNDVLVFIREPLKV